MQVRSQQGETLDAICWRELGRSRAVVEDTLARNPGLADAGPILPEGTIITLPDAVPAVGNSRKLIQLWD